MQSIHSAMPPALSPRQGDEWSEAKRRGWRVNWTTTISVPIFMNHDDSRYPYNSKEQAPHRRMLRNEGTSAEATLWLSLKDRQIEGVRWRRQFGVGPYILDFYCHQLRLCIELDGASHYTIQGSENDLQRDEWLLQTHGIRTIRFENKDVFIHHEAVIEHIREVVKSLIA